MSSRSAIRLALPTKVARGLDGFTARLREPAELQPCGVAELDALLGGGFPRGALVEICGTASSGRTSLTLALLAQAIGRQEACAFVDVSDALDPLSVAAAGVDATRLLWIRCGGMEGSEVAKKFGRKSEPENRDKKSSAPAAQHGPVKTSNFDGAAVDAAAFAVTDASAAHAQPTGARASAPCKEKLKSFGWTHPRDAMRGVETSIPGLMRRPPKAPSYEEMSFAVRCAGEQVEPDRQPPRRGENLQRRFSAQARIESWNEEEEGSNSTQESSARSEENIRREENTGRKESSTPQKRGSGAPLDERSNAPLNSNAKVLLNSHLNASSTNHLGDEFAPKFTVANLAWTRANTKPWRKLEQALKTTDLLLHSGGWGVVVVDLGGISWVQARRIPMHTWFRFRRVVENSPTILVLLGEESCAKSCASLVLQCRRVGEKWSSAANEAIRKPDAQRKEISSGAGVAACETGSGAKKGVTTLQGFEVQAEVACSRMQRLRADAARWQTHTLWNGG